MATVRIKGGPELKARLAAIVGSKLDIERAWAQDASKRIAGDAPRRTGRLAGSIHPDERRGKAVVKGAWYGVILDRGTRAYPIEGKRGQALKFSYRGRTVFAKKVNRRRLRRRPFITANAQAALQAAPIANQIIRAWNRKSSRGRFSRLTL
jgi:hypothetical protein